MRTTIVIPTYNEKENVERMAAAVLAAAPEAHLLIVDDNSPDGTGDTIEALRTDSGWLDEKARARLHCLHRAKKEGLGRAYIAGFELALNHGAEKIVQMDCDFSHDPADIMRLVEAPCELAIGSRYVPGGATPGWPFRRRLISRAGGAFIRAVTGMPLRDPTGGFKAWSASALRAVDFQSVESAGYSFQLEMNHRAWKEGLKILELPIKFADRTRGTSKISGAIALESLKIAWRLRRR